VHGNPQWLSQGDLFEKLPMPAVSVEELLERPVGINFKATEGPALLITYSSVIDKRTRSAQVPQAKQLHFAPVYEVAALGRDPDSIERLRRGDTNPADAIMLRHGETESIALLGAPFYLPAPFFRLEARNFSGLENADPADPIHVCPSVNDTRSWSMDEEELELLQEKLVFFWARGTMRA
jgi:hypothetical protein